MNAEHSSAFWTFPAYSFLFDKRIHSQRLDRFEVFDHAHPVFSSIALVNMLDARAGELGTIHAQPRLDVFEILAVLNAATDAGNGGLFRIIPIAAGAVLLLPKISHAESAIHTTGGDEKGSDF